MEAADLELIEKYKQENYELERLWSEHLEFEEKIDKLEAATALSAAEEQDLHKLKKMKLQGRDDIENILKTLR